MKVPELEGLLQLICDILLKQFEVLNVKEGHARIKVFVLTERTYLSKPFSVSDDNGE